MKLFVYGTLRRGGINEPMLEGQAFVGKCVIPGDSFKLYQIDGRFRFPALVSVDKGGYPVYGELYEVTEPCLKQLDILEGIAHGLYERCYVTVQLPEGESYANVITYRYCQDVDSSSIHVGQVWPKHELNRYRSLGYDIKKIERETEVAGCALWNKRHDVWMTDVFATEELLKSACQLRRKAYGARDGIAESWSPQFFEARPRTTMQTMEKFEFSTRTTNYVFDNREELAKWAADNAVFFGGMKGSVDEWREVVVYALPMLE